MRQGYLPFHPKGKREYRRLTGEGMRAWKCSDRRVSGEASVIHATDVGHARTMFLGERRKQDPSTKFTDITAVRSAEHDGKQERPKRARKAKPLAL
jgi:hypothetical protein